MKGSFFLRMVGQAFLPGRRSASRNACATIAIALLVFGAIILVIALTEAGVPTIDAFENAGRRPVIFPEYADCTIPPNIAPLNFMVKEEGDRFVLRISGEKGERIEVADDSGRMRIPLGRWRSLLEANRGGKMVFEIFARIEGRWIKFEPVTNDVADEPIDRYLVYRDMPSYNLVWSDMGVYQRDLEGFGTRAVLRNDMFGHGCLNCHTFRDNRTEDMIVIVRPSTGSPGIQGGMTIVRDGKVSGIVDTTTAFNAVPGRYLAWHPSGRAVSFTTNVALRAYHTAGFNADVFDADSDALIYRIDTNTVSTDPRISQPDRLETYTTWSPERVAGGHYMYYCSAKKRPPSEHREVRYDLMRVLYDIDNDAWGEPETVIAADAMKKSVTFPRISPDGRWLLFCVADSGNFPAFNPASDLAIMDLATGEWDRLDISSDGADSYHSWSSNGRWFVFSSKRLDGFLTRLFLCHVDADGRARKPLLLPQEAPAFYEHHIRIFNVPELVAEPVRIRERELAGALCDPANALKAKLDPRVPPRREAERTVPRGPADAIQ